MGVLHYKTSLGYFPIIVDDDAYDFLSVGTMPYSIDLITADGSYTSHGTTFKSNMFTNQTIFQAIVNTDNWHSGINNWFSLFPLTTITNINVSTGYDNTVLTSLSTDPTREVSVRIRNSGSDNPLRISSSANLIYNNERFPVSAMYPAFRPDTSEGTTANYMFAEYFVTKSDYTSFKRIQISLQDSGKIRLSWSVCTPGDILFLKAYFEGVPPIVLNPDPYSDIPDSQAGGGTGTFDFTTSDDIDFPPLPTLSAVSTGFVSLWSPTEEQMLRLSSFMWNADILTTDFWKKLIANPMELIYGLSLVPLNLSSLGYIDSEGTVVVGLINTGITMNHLSSQWVLFDCGTITIDETWGAYLDYDPYTKLEIYLPFCGAHPLKVDDFMPGTISLKYYIDLLSGTCVAVVKSIKSNKHGDVLDSVVYQFMGNCAAQIPVTAQQFADAVRAAINIASSIGSMVATGVGGAAAAAGAKNALGGISTTAHTVSQEVSTGASVVENVMNIKPAIERSGAIGSAGSLLSVRTPYLILTRPRMARPESQNVYTGYPSFITETLGDLKGWTIVQAIHLDNIPCTADEINEIDELLKGGVIF